MSLHHHHPRPLSTGKTLIHFEIVQLRASLETSIFQWISIFLK
jgi:hypothetical protein